MQRSNQFYVLSSLREAGKGAACYATPGPLTGRKMPWVNPKINQCRWIGSTISSFYCTNLHGRSYLRPALNGWPGLESSRQASGHLDGPPAHDS